MKKVSALIISYNEEKNIERALSSLLWVDEIVVVDAFSKDLTKKLCLLPSAPWASKIKFYERAWSGFKDQRNFSLDQASHEWVFILDADEACSKELQEKITGLLSLPEGPPFQAYQVRRTEYFLGKAITHGIWNPSYQDRFFNKTGVRYINEIHEFPQFKSPPQPIHESILHCPDFHPDQFLDKMNRYTTVEAKERVKNGQITSVFKIFFAFPAMFLKNYFYYKAYKDGTHGFIISLLEGVSRVVRHIKIWQLTHKK